MTENEIDDYFEKGEKNDDAVGIVVVLGRDGAVLDRTLHSHLCNAPS